MHSLLFSCLLFVISHGRIGVAGQVADATTAPILPAPAADAEVCRNDLERALESSKSQYSIAQRIQSKLGGFPTYPIFCCLEQVKPALRNPASCPLNATFRCGPVKPDAAKGATESIYRELISERAEPTCRPTSKQQSEQKPASESKTAENIFRPPREATSASLVTTKNEIRVKRQAKSAAETWCESEDIRGEWSASTSSCFQLVKYPDGKIFSVVMVEDAAHNCINEYPERPEGYRGRLAHLSDAESAAAASRALTKHSVYSAYVGVKRTTSGSACDCSELFLLDGPSGLEPAGQLPWHPTAPTPKGHAGCQCDGDDYVPRSGPQPAQCFQLIGENTWLDDITCRSPAEVLCEFLPDGTTSAPPTEGTAETTRASSSASDGGAAAWCDANDGEWSTSSSSCFQVSDRPKTSMEDAVAECLGKTDLPEGYRSRLAHISDSASALRASHIIIANSMASAFVGIKRAALGAPCDCSELFLVDGPSGLEDAGPLPWHPTPKTGQGCQCDAQGGLCFKFVSGGNKHLDDIDCDSSDYALCEITPDKMPSVSVPETANAAPPASSSAVSDERGATASVGEAKAWCETIVGGNWAVSTSSCFKLTSRRMQMVAAAAECVGFADLPQGFRGRLAHIADTESAEVANQALGSETVAFVGVKRATTGTPCNCSGLFLVDGPSGLEEAGPLPWIPKECRCSQEAEMCFWWRRGLNILVDSICASSRHGLCEFTSKKMPSVSVPQTTTAGPPAASSAAPTTAASEEGEETASVGDAKAWCEALPGGNWSASTSSCFKLTRVKLSMAAAAAECTGWANLPQGYRGRLAHIVDNESAEVAHRAVGHSNTFVGVKGGRTGDPCTCSELFLVDGPSGLEKAGPLPWRPLHGCRCSKADDQCFGWWPQNSDFFTNSCEEPNYGLCEFTPNKLPTTTTPPDASSAALTTTTSNEGEETASVGDAKAWCEALPGGEWSTSTSSCFQATSNAKTMAAAAAECICWANLPQGYRGRLAHIVDNETATVANRAIGERFEHVLVGIKRATTGHPCACSELYLVDGPSGLEDAGPLVWTPKDACSCATGDYCFRPSDMCLLWSSLLPRLISTGCERKWPALCEFTPNKLPTTSPSSPSPCGSTTGAAEEATSAAATWCEALPGGAWSPSTSSCFHLTSVKHTSMTAAWAECDGRAGLPEGYRGRLAHLSDAGSATAAIAAIAATTNACSAYVGAKRARAEDPCVCSDLFLVDGPGGSDEAGPLPWTPTGADPYGDPDGGCACQEGALCFQFVGHQNYLDDNQCETEFEYYGLCEFTPASYPTSLSSSSTKTSPISTTSASSSSTTTPSSSSTTTASSRSTTTALSSSTIKTSTSDSTTASPGVLTSASSSSTTTSSSSASSPAITSASSTVSSTTPLGSTTKTSSSESTTTSASSTTTTLSTTSITVSSSKSTTTSSIESTTSSSSSTITTPSNTLTSTLSSSIITATPSTSARTSLTSIMISSSSLFTTSSTDSITTPPSSTTKTSSSESTTTSSDSTVATISSLFKPTSSSESISPFLSSLTTVSSSSTSTAPPSAVTTASSTSTPITWLKTFTTASPILSTTASSSISSSTASASSATTASSSISSPASSGSTATAFIPSTATSTVSSTASTTSASPSTTNTANSPIRASLRLVTPNSQDSETVAKVLGSAAEDLLPDLDSVVDYALDPQLLDDVKLLSERNHAFLQSLSTDYQDLNDDPDDPELLLRLKEKYLSSPGALSDSSLPLRPEDDEECDGAEDEEEEWLRCLIRLQHRKHVTTLFWRSPTPYSEEKDSSTTRTKKSSANSARMAESTPLATEQSSLIVLCCGLAIQSIHLFSGSDEYSILKPGELGGRQERSFEGVRVEVPRLPESVTQLCAADSDIMRKMGVHSGEPLRALRYGEDVVKEVELTFSCVDKTTGHMRHLDINHLTEPIRITVELEQASEDDWSEVESSLRLLSRHLIRRHPFQSTGNFTSLLVQFESNSKEEFILMVSSDAYPWLDNAFQQLLVKASQDQTEWLIGPFPSGGEFYLGVGQLSKNGTLLDGFTWSATIADYRISFTSLGCKTLASRAASDAAFIPAEATLRGDGCRVGNATAPSQVSCECDKL